MMFGGGVPKRFAYAIVVVGLVGSFVLAVFGPVRGGAAGHDTGMSPAVVALGAVLLVALLVVLASALRESRRFLRLAELLVTVMFWLYVAGLGVAAVEFAAGSDSIVLGSSSIRVTTYDIEIEGDSGTSFSESPAAGDKYARAWLREHYGRGAEFTQSSVVRVSVQRPSATAVVLTGAALLLWYGAWLAGLWFLRAILRRAADGSPFDARNAAAMRAIAVALLVGWFGVAVVEHAATGAAISSAGGTANLLGGLHGTLLIAALAVAALAEVWRYGIALQEESEATV